MTTHTLTSFIGAGTAQIVVPGTSAGLVPASGLPGGSGALPAAGVIGETITGTITPATLTTAYAAQGTGITLTSSGVWLFHFDVYAVVSANGGATPFSQISVNVALFSGASLVAGSERTLLLQNPEISTSYGMASGVPLSYTGVIPNATGTYTVQAKYTVYAGSGTYSIQNTSPNSSSFYCTRIA